MIRVNLKGLIDRYEKTANRRLTLDMLEKATGVHRRVLSRLVNYPLTNTTLEQIDKLAQFFYRELRAPNEDPYEFMQKTISDLVEVYPDQKRDPSSTETYGPQAAFEQLVPIKYLWDMWAGGDVQPNSNILKRMQKEQSASKSPKSSKKKKIT